MIHLCPWQIKQCYGSLIQVSGGCEDLDEEQQALAELWQEWHWVLGHAGSKIMPFLVLHGPELYGPQ